MYTYLFVCIVNGVKLNRLSLITGEPTKMGVGLVSELLLNHEVGWDRFVHMKQQDFITLWL
jgi:hypothetical protein